MECSRSSCTWLKGPSNGDTFVAIRVREPISDLVPLLGTAESALKSTEFLEPLN